MRHPAALGLGRRLTVRVPAGLTAWFLAGESAKAPRVFDGERLDERRSESAEVAAAGRLLVIDQPDGRAVAMNLQASGPARWRVEPFAGGWRTLVMLPGGAAEHAQSLTVRVWALPATDADLLRTLLAVK
jgi:hypothetical protein